ncbi:MAG: DNA polymerase III subunit delta [bacterium]
MIYFLYGEDNYSLHQKLREIEQSFLEAEKTDLNISKLDGAKIKKNDFLGIISAMPFLGTKRLIIINNFLLENKDETLIKYIEKNMATFPDYSEIVFAENGLPDGKGTLFKALKKMPNAIQSPLLDERAVKQWIEARVAELGCKIYNDAIYKLQFFVGADLWRLENEIIKLSMYAKHRGTGEIVQADIELLVQSENLPGVFDLTDAIAAKNEKKALLILHQSLNGGEEEMKMFNIIISHYRKMLIIDDLLVNHRPLELSKIHPFVAKKIQSTLRLFRKNEVKRNFLMLQDIDVRIKTGKIDAKTALDCFIVDCCS